MKHGPDHSYTKDRTLSADATETLSTLSYKTLFSALQFGYGSAMATAMFLTEAMIALGFGIFILRRLRS